MKTTYHVVDTSSTKNLLGEARIRCAPRACSHKHRTVTAQSPGRCAAPADSQQRGRRPECGGPDSRSSPMRAAAFVR